MLRSVSLVGDDSNVSLFKQEGLFNHLLSLLTQSPHFLCLSVQTCPNLSKPVMSTADEPEEVMAFIRVITPGDNSAPRTVAMNADTIVQVANSDRLATRLQQRLSFVPDFSLPCVEVKRDTVLDEATGLTPVLVEGPVSCGAQLRDKNGYVFSVNRVDACGEPSSPHLTRILLHSPGTKRGTMLLAGQRLTVIEPEAH